MSTLTIDHEPMLESGAVVGRAVPKWEANDDSDADWPADYPDPADYDNETDYISAIPGMKDYLMRMKNAPASAFRPRSSSLA